MVETKTTTDDEGRRCDCCGERLAMRRTWWICGHGEYCSVTCALTGASELEQAIQRAEESFVGKGR